jgi:two-component system OmpR family sensor kinase
VFNFIRQTVFLAKTGTILENKSNGIALVKSRKTEKMILKTGSVVFKKKMPRLRYRIELLKFNGDEYLYLQSKSGNILVKRNKSANVQRILLFAWIALNFILAFLYIGIYRSIRPLSKFREKMEEFKKGDMNIDLGEYIKRKDEVGYIAREFKDAVLNIKRNLNARVWFIRNIAHELKTPITKGKIALELLENEKADKKIIFANIFARLELLINELFTAEKIAIAGVKINITPCSLDNVINKAEALLFADNLNSQAVLTADKDYIIRADSEMLVVAVKNLLDNGIKFSSDKRVAVKIEKGILTFTNNGPKPSISEELIFEPFLKDQSVKNKDGFGLGLYITKQILEKHGLDIIYSYKEGKNIFSIDINPLLA